MEKCNSRWTSWLWSFEIMLSQLLYPGWRKGTHFRSTAEKLNIWVEECVGHRPVCYLDLNHYLSTSTNCYVMYLSNSTIISTNEPRCVGEGQGPVWQPIRDPAASHALQASHVSHVSDESRKKLIWKVFSRPIQASVASHVSHVSARSKHLEFWKSR